MKTVALVYSQHTAQTAELGGRIAAAWGSEVVYLDPDTTRLEDWMKYELFILGTPTYFDGELPNSWDEFLPELEDADLSGRKVAVYGLGDQQHYPVSFADGVGLLASYMEELGATIVGETSTEGYSYEHSVAERDGRFLGLVLDPTNQPELTDQRLAAWLEQLKVAFAG